jgi:acetyl-CoA carboxylase biotin carboxyl carrier protein
VNLRELKEIFRMVEKTDFSEVEIVQGDMRVRIERGRGAKMATVATVPPVFVSPQSTHATAQAVPSEVASEERTERGGLTGSSRSNEMWVTSPFVGTFYRAPSPDAEPYVQLGQVVRKGQPLCIVEAMKLMNEIESDFDGKIVEICVESGTPVEFGEKLFRIEPGA